MCSSKKQSLSLIKGVLLYLVLISFMEKQLNSEAKPSQKIDKERIVTKQNEIKKKKHTFKVEHLQYTSSCTYVVEPVSKRGYRFAELEELYDIKCVNISQPCSTTERPEHKCVNISQPSSTTEQPKHKCMQTFKTIKIGKNSNESMKIYTGCVCAYSRHGSNKTSIENDNS